MVYKRRVEYLGFSKFFFAYKIIKYCKRLEAHCKILEMYSKLSYLFLVGLISQSIAAPNSLDKLDVGEIIREQLRSTQVWPYIEKCVQRDDSSNFDPKLLESQIDELSLVVDNSLSLDEITKQAKTIFDNLIDGLDNDNLTKIVEQANHDLKFLVKSIKKSDLHKTVEIIDKSRRKLMEVLIIRDKAYNEIRSLNYEFMKAVILKEYPELFKLLSHFLQNVTDVINRYQKSDGIHELEKKLQSTIEVTRAQIDQTNVPGKVMVPSIEKFVHEVLIIFNIDMFNDYKVSAVRCSAEYRIRVMLMLSYLIEFRSVTDS